VTKLFEVLSGTRRWCVVHGEAADVLWVLPDACIDSMVVDPPSGIGFMGRAWDKDGGSRDIWCERLEAVMREAYRVLKPGAYGLVWALPRTSHWTALALEDAGFEIRDRFIHLFGTGFPKSLDVSKAIDAGLGTTAQRKVVHEYTAGGNAGTSTAEKGGTYAVGAPNSAPVNLAVTTGGSPEAQQWDGWGTALKPAAEDWWLVRKPLVGTVADNVLGHGCGGLNIDACRIATDWHERSKSWKLSGHSAKPDAAKIAAPPGIGIQCHPGGRWPAHVVFSHSEECGDRCVAGCPVGELDKQSGVSTAGGPVAQRGTGSIWSPSTGLPAGAQHGDSGTASRFFYCAKPGRAERELGLDGFKPTRASEVTGERKDDSLGLNSPRAGAGRGGGARNRHPTVKSLDLMRWLVRLITPPGGVVLDSFCGSGSTGMAAIIEGMRFIGVELNNTEDEPFVSLARARIAHCAGWKTPPMRDAEPPRQRSLFE
jgi:hypothetical protein